jgi:hypothetical protein
MRRGFVRPSRREAELSNADVNSIIARLARLAIDNNAEWTEEERRKEEGNRSPQGQPVW